MRSHSVGKNLVANTKTTLFTVPARNIAHWNLLFLHNSTTVAKTFSVWWYDSSADVEVPVFDSISLTAKEYLKFDNAYVVLDEGDEIRIQTETGAVASVIITVELDVRSAVQQYK